MDQTNKQNFLLHYTDSKFDIQHGMKVAKLHIAYQFEQSQWPETFLKSNADQRVRARNLSHSS